RAECRSDLASPVLRRFRQELAGLSWSEVYYFDCLMHSRVISQSGLIASSFCAIAVQITHPTCCTETPPVAQKCRSLHRKCRSLHKNATRCTEMLQRCIDKERP